MTTKPINGHLFLEAQGETLFLKGEWTIARSDEIIRIVREGQHDRYRQVDVSGVARLDSWGAYFIREKMLAGDAEVKLTDTQRKLFDLLQDPSKPQPAAKQDFKVSQLIEAAGRKSSHAAQEFSKVLIFIGHASVRFARNFASPRAFRVHSIIRHIDETGLKAVPIIGLLAILISMVISYQAATQLQKFGANIFTVDLTVISLLREMAVLVTAIMFAGRSGSAFAAEIGVMKLREEVDALRTMGLDPFEVLVVPRVIALMITLPILTFLADMVGLAGGGVIATTLLDIPVDQYIDRVQTVAKPTMFFVGMIKAPVFAFIIAIVGTYQGMNITGSAESVGRLTTISVVQSIFLVILADALFSIVFANLGL